MHKNYYLEVIGEKPALFAELVRFNTLGPELWLKTDQDGSAAPWEGVPAEVLEALWEHAPSRRHLQTCCEACPEPFWDFSEPSRCLALLDTQTLDALTLFYGASLHAQQIARTIMGKDMAQLREHLGERAHEYALRRGQYQAPWARKIFEARHSTLPLAQRALLHGQEALGLLLSSWPATLRGRLPARMVAAIPKDLSSSTEWHQGIWFDMKRLLLKEVAPAWLPCFA